MRPLPVIVATLGLLLVNPVPAPAADPGPLAGVHRAVFLGDSITYSGQYIEFIEAYLRIHSPSLHWDAPARELTDTINGEKVLAARPHGLDVLKLVQQKQRLLKDAWLTATGHQRPGMKPGIPLEQADQRARELETEIRKLMTPAL